MKNYEKFYKDINNGKIYKNNDYTELLKRIFNRVPIDFNNINKDLSNYFISHLLTCIDFYNINPNLIDDNFLIITGPHSIKHLYFINLLKTVYLPIDMDEFGIYMETFNFFLKRTIMNDNNKDLIDNLKYQKIKDLYHNYKKCIDKIMPKFNYCYDYDLPTMLFAYFYGNNLDLNITNDVLLFYIDNRDYYLDKMNLNGLYFPFDYDDTIPKYFLGGYLDLYKEFIPVLIDNYNNGLIKKRIK